ncbi:MAG TPA: hypothetical protein DCG49_01690 [Ruminococcus sp.]|nr:hypothetical protein [Ruminococcus sp.]
MFKMQFGEPEMMQKMQDQLLYPNETVQAAVYCSFQDTGFFASPYHMMIGYVGLTSHDRLIGSKSGYITTEPLHVDLSSVTKLKAKRSLFGQYQVYLEYYAEKGKGKLKFVVPAKIYGQKFPNQREYAQILMQALQERQAQLR